MRERLESLMLVLAVGAAVAIAAKRVGAPYNVALVVVGLLLVFADVLPHTPLDPEIVLVAFLPVLVFEGALFADVDALRREARPILTLALPGVAVSLLGTAVVATVALRLPFSAALLLGALLAITDTVSVLLAFRSVRVPPRLAAIMEGESLFNDGTALVLVSLTAGVLATGKLDAATTIRNLLAAIGGGLAVGAAFGAVGAMVLRRTPDHLTAILASSVLVFATALLAERMHASPVIAVVVVGLAIGRAARKILEPSRVLALQGFWEVAGFVINVVLFLLVGMQIEAKSLITEAGSIALALVALHAGRALAVYGSFGIFPRARAAVPTRWRHVMVLGNIKGALSMAAVLALPEGLAYRERLVSIVFGVTFVTLITQALPFGRLLRLLGVTLGSNATENRAKATLIAARRGQSELAELLATGLVSRKDHAERRAELQRQVIEAESVLRGRPDEPGLDPHVEISLLTAQKAALTDAARRGLVDNEAADHLIGELDRQLLATRHHEQGEDQD
jgi:CPA1 family monovalent cation:H+ antiporter